MPREVINPVEWRKMLEIDDKASEELNADFPINSLVLSYRYSDEKCRHLPVDGRVVAKTRCKLIIIQSSFSKNIHLQPRSHVRKCGDSLLSPVTAAEVNSLFCNLINKIKQNNPGSDSDKLIELLTNCYHKEGE